MKKSVQKLLAGLAVLAAVGWVFHAGADRVHTASSTDFLLAQQSYVWQRSWNADVRASVQAHAGSFDRLVVLGAEIRWQRETPTIARVEWDAKALASSGRPIGIAIRSGTYRGDFESNGPAAAAITDLADALVKKAQASGLTVAEMQLDFDCPESKLDGYRRWVTAVQQRVAPVPVTITTLPCWLKQPAFRRLVSSLPEYVLQVHALERPASPTAAAMLCDPIKAKLWVEQANDVGVPFRVALPTYGYSVAFDASGKYAGATAEQPGLIWPASTSLIDLRADPAAMAGLVREWSGNRPRFMRGIIWYRLPCESDTLNWRWNTLAAVMSGRKPHAALSASVCQTEPGLCEIIVENQGDCDSRPNLRVELGWPNTQPLQTADGLNGFVWNDAGHSSGTFSGTKRIAPQDRIVMGWLKFKSETEAHVTARITN